MEDAAKKTEKTAEEITEKYGLEAGLWNVFRSKDNGKGNKGTQAKDLLKRYGSAYLITSISFAIVSFSICYALVGAGTDSKPQLACSTAPIPILHDTPQTSQCGRI